MIKKLKNAIWWFYSKEVILVMENMLVGHR